MLCYHTSVLAQNDVDVQRPQSHTSNATSRYTPASSSTWNLAAYPGRAASAPSVSNPGHWFVAATYQRWYSVDPHTLCCRVSEPVNGRSIWFLYRNFVRPFPSPKKRLELARRALTFSNFRIGPRRKSEAADRKQPSVCTWYRFASGRTAVIYSWLSIRCTDQLVWYTTVVFASRRHPDQSIVASMTSSLTNPATPYVPCQSIPAFPPNRTTSFLRAGYVLAPTTDDSQGADRDAAISKALEGGAWRGHDDVRREGGVIKSQPTAPVYVAFRCILLPVL